MIEEQIVEGKLFIYPTDTIYGLGCNALNEKSVEKIKEIKAREKDKPLSIIAPCLEWIEKHCFVDADLKKYLPGPYTLILKKKNPGFLSYVSKGETLGIRIPACDFTEHVRKANVPFITTSVNLSGQPFANEISDIPKEIINKVDVVIDAGTLSGRPSILVIGGKEIER